MPTSVLIYRTASNRGLLVAFVCAGCIFAGALCLGNTRRNVATISGETGFESPARPADPAVEVSVESEPDVVPTAVPPDDAFPEETIAPRVRPVAKKPMKPVTRPPVAARPGAAIAASGKDVALFAPRPDYPYEARRQGAVGAGLVRLTIDSGSGSVTVARMERSTGRSVLDASALRAFSRWRFRPGTAPVIEIPITFRLTGVSY